MEILMIHQMREYCENNNLFAEGDRVLVGLSGGADSVCLACMLKELGEMWKLQIRLVHVNHGIRGPEAERDELFCCDFARQMELPITVFHGDVPSLAREEGMSEEEAGRHYRYQCMEQLRRQLGFDKIAVAHHQDDQAETVLFQLLRGSSLRGLGGMCPVRGKVVRPLLIFQRKDIVQELLRLGQSWCEDSTNQEMACSRNKLRHSVIPYLEREVAPGAVRHLARMAGQMQEVSDYLSAETDRAYGRLVQAEAGRLEAEAGELCRLHPVLQREVVMRMFEQLAGSRKDITGRHVENVCALAAGPTGRRLTLPYRMRAGKDYQTLWLEQTLCEGQQDGEDILREEGVDYIWQIGETGPKEFFLNHSLGKSGRIIMEKTVEMELLGQNRIKVLKNNCTKWFDYAKINGMLEFRHPREGDFFLLDAAGKRKKLSRFLIDSKVSLERRHTLWVLAMGSHILWIPEMGRSSAGFYVTEDTKEMLCATYEECEKHF